MSSYNQFVTAMNDVQSLATDLHKSMTICRTAKESMGTARGLLAVNGMTIVALYKRRQKQYEAFVLMVKLRKFLKTRQEMNDRAKVGDFGTAFRLCMQVRDLYNDLKLLKCMHPIALALKNDVDDLRVRMPSFHLSPSSLGQRCHSTPPFAQIGLLVVFCDEKSTLFGFSLFRCHVLTLSFPALGQG